MGKTRLMVVAVQGAPLFVLTLPMILAGETVTANLYRDVTSKAEKSDDSGHSPTVTLSWVLEGCTGTIWCESQLDASCTPVFDVTLMP
jgi:hypothetical protein